MLVRTQPAQQHAYTDFAIVDYSDGQSLKKALSGHDAVVSCLPRTLILDQLSLIDIAIEAGVRRFIPSEFGANLQNEKARKLVNYRDKVKVENYLSEKAAAGEITYTLIYTNALLDWSIRAGIILDLYRQSISLYDGGENAVSMITISAAAQAVVGVLSRPFETNNRSVCVHEAVLSQKDLLAHAKAIWPEHSWKETVVDLVQLEEGARKQAMLDAASNANMTIFHAGAMSGGFAKGYGNRYGEEDNQLLGIERMGNEDLKGLLRTLYEEAQPKA